MVNEADLTTLTAGTGLNQAPKGTAAKAEPMLGAEFSWAGAFHSEWLDRLSRLADGQAGSFVCEGCEERHEAPDDGPRRYRGRPLCGDCYADIVGGANAARAVGVI